MHLKAIEVDLSMCPRDGSADITGQLQHEAHVTPCSSSPMRPQIDGHPSPLWPWSPTRSDARLAIASPSGQLSSLVLALHGSSAGQDDYSSKHSDGEESTQSKPLHAEPLRGTVSMQAEDLQDEEHTATERERRLNVELLAIEVEEQLLKERKLAVLRQRYGGNVPDKHSTSPVQQDTPDRAGSAQSEYGVASGAGSRARGGSCAREQKQY